MIKKCLVFVFAIIFTTGTKLKAQVKSVRAPQPIEITDSLFVTFHQDTVSGNSVTENDTNFLFNIRFTIYDKKERKLVPLGVLAVATGVNFVTLKIF